ncbi:hypothetical protein AA81_02525 [Petrotoga halophila DSM 16923]|uniref:Uncharacterized protein n=1 Tax=Petrotoga halophila DSM 16923 TaxID=1122953 RepID=A0A2S5EJE4_9BACT|nr:hypothetical protein AA81_02525 [Petrotoga halophila DSM 16923]
MHPILSFIFIASSILKKLCFEYLPDMEIGNPNTIKSSWFKSNETKYSNSFSDGIVSFGKGIFISCFKKAIPHFLVP